LAVDLYFSNIVIPALSGVFLFSIPLFMLLFLLRLIFQQLQILKPFNANNSVADKLTLALMQQYNYQRFGVLFFITGVYILMKAARAVVPIPTKEKVGTFSKQEWYKTHFLFCKVLFILFQTSVVLITKLPVYKQYVEIMTIVLLVVQTGFMLLM